MKKTVQKMQENQGFKEHTAESQSKQETPKKPTTNTNDEYIEFEEVK